MFYEFINEYFMLIFKFIIAVILVGLGGKIYSKKIRTNTRYSHRNRIRLFSRLDFLTKYMLDIVVAQSKNYKAAPIGSKDNISQVKTGVLGEIAEGLAETEPENHSAMLQKQVDLLPAGKILFNPPSVMELGKSERIEVRITEDLEEKLEVDLKGRGFPKTKEIQISKLLRVRLIGTEDEFQIVTLSQEEQMIVSLKEQNYTEWVWNVIPKKLGTFMLHLHVSLVIKSQYGEGLKDWPVMDEEILVTISKTKGLLYFAAKYWQWIVAAILIPIFLLIWTKYF